MRIIILIAAIALVTTSAMAHNPLTAKFELNVLPQEGAMLNVYVSQTGLHQALIKHYTKSDFTTISVTDYKKLVVQYLKKHIEIEADNTLLKIGEGGIKLGDHQTDLKFLIENYPGEVNSLEVNIDAFKENENHHSVFWWKNKSGKAKVILSAKNNYQGFLGAMNNNNFILAALSEINQVWLILGISSSLLFSGLFFRKKRISRLAHPV